MELAEDLFQRNCGNLDVYLYLLEMHLSARSGVYCGCTREVCTVADARCTVSAQHASYVAEALGILKAGAHPIQISAEFQVAADLLQVSVPAVV